MKAIIISSVSLLVLLFSCAANPGGPGGIGDSSSTSSASGPPPTNGVYNFTITTRTHGGAYPAYVLAAWIETPGGDFVKTVKLYGTFPEYMNALVDWIAAGGEYGPTWIVDGWSGASRHVISHGAVGAQWYTDHRSGTNVFASNYVLQVEFTENNAQLGDTSWTENANLPLTWGGTAYTNSISTTYIDLQAVYTPTTN